jgi:uncharacterized NAD(P)/FAD-binding protein YdhS
MRVAIVGGGFAGAAAAIALLRTLPPGHSIAIYEPAEEIGRGIAYARGRDHYLLNVAAHTVSLAPDDENEFCTWAVTRFPHAEEFWEDDGAFFFPRTWFGTYVHEHLRAACDQNPGVAFAHMREVARSIALEGDAFVVRSADGAHVFDRIILAIGNGPPSPIPTLEPAGGVGPIVIQSAWDFEPGIVGKTDRVAVIGGALTMADVVADLENCGHRGPITCVSRNGRRPHVTIGMRPDFSPTDALPTTLTARKLVSLARKWSAESIAENGDWRPGVDYLRRNGTRLWRALPLIERRRLRRHARSLWEIHRYRMPPAAHRRIEALIASGRFAHLRGKVLGTTARGLRIDTSTGPQDVPADIVINATGFDTSYRTALAPIGDLLAVIGIDLGDTARNGLSVDDHGRLLNVEPGLFGRLYALGFLARANHGDLATINTINAVAMNIATDIAAVQDGA